MFSASRFTYISKKKVDIVNKAKSKKTEEIPELEEGYNSDIEMDDNDEAEFMEAAPPVPLVPSAPPAMGAPAYIPPALPKEEEKKPKSHKKHKQEIDTNIMKIDLSTLEHPGQLETGEPYFCSQCNAVLSIHSKSTIGKPDPSTGKTAWVCEFCNTKNELIIDEEEIPKADTVTYLMEKVIAPIKPQAEEMKDVPTTGGEQKQDLTDDITVVFCLDVSGSMDAAKFVKDGKPMKYVKNKSYPTRLEGVKVAIDNQIEKMIKETPNRKVGFVTFENKVQLIGDGTKAPCVFEGEKLDSNFFTLLEEAVNYSGTHMGMPLKDTCPSLLEKLKAIRTGGSTALGPGLIVSLALAAQGKPGSKVIICTDGLANKGVGKIEGIVPKQEHMVREFYNQAAEYAKQHGVSISIVTLVESECRLDMLAPVANLTGGDILRVDPMKLSEDFSAFLAEKIIATNVSLKVKLHKGLKFRNELEKNLSADQTTMNKEVGNATRDSVVTFEYCMKRPHELAQMADIDWDKLAKIPFQSQITYKTIDGRKCLKVITNMQEVTHEKEEAKKVVDANIVGAHAAFTSAQLAERGDYRAAAMNAVAWGKGVSPVLADQMAVKSRVKGLYEAVAKQEMMAAPQMDALTSEINKAYKHKK